MFYSYSYILVQNKPVNIWNFNNYISFTNFNFFKGVADLTGDKEATQYSLLDVSQTESMSPGREDKASTLHTDCQEFARIKQM